MWRLSRSPFSDVLASIRNKNVAEAPDGLQVAWFRRIILDQFAQARHLDVDGAIKDFVLAAARQFGQFVPALKPEAKPQRDVSGTDLAPVARYPGLARTDWQRWGKQITIEYEGEADYAMVLDYYAKGFAAQGFVQAVQSATVTAETHDYTKGNERIGMTIAQKPKGGISVKLNLTLQ